MASTPAQLVRAFQANLALQDALLDRQLDRARDRVITKYASGSGNINNVFDLDVPFRVVFVRCHFTGGTGTAGMILDINSAQGIPHDTRLTTITAVGAGTDVFYTPGGAAIADPSSWSFQSSDQLRVKWTNPDAGNMNWGLEVGLAPAA